MKHNIPTFPREAHDLLSQLFTKEDVRQATFQMHPTKAPGPDGFPPVFFQKFWPAIGNLVMMEVLKILDTDIESWNETNIVLVPKVKKPCHMKDFRPISLCNTIYKIVSKIVANRLKTIIEQVVYVYPMQSAFIKGKLIYDNIIVGYECLHWLRQQKKGKSGYTIAKLDMSKAYDRVEWEYLRAILKAMKFPIYFSGANYEMHYFGKILFRDQWESL